MTVEPPIVSRVIDRPTILNMRDLGGLRTRTGSLHRGLVFRAGSFAGTSAEDASWLVRTTRLRTVVDLRTRREIDRDGTPDTLRALGVAWRSVPFGFDGFLAGGNAGSGRFAAEYRRLALHAAEPVRQILTVVDDGALPLVFVCSPGKDRTGVVAALLLSALDVRRRDILRDYALTARCLRSRADLVRALAHRKGLPEREVAGRLETRQATMGALLDAVGHDHPDGWSAHAVDTTLVERARSALVEAQPGERTHRCLI